MLQGCVPHAFDHFDHEGASSKINEPYRAGSNGGRSYTAGMRNGSGQSRSWLQQAFGTPLLVASPLEAQIRDHHWIPPDPETGRSI